MTNLYWIRPIEGVWENCNLNTNHHLEIEPSSSSGVWHSKVYDCSPFSELVLSWNSVTPPQTQIECFVRVRCNQKWSSWMSYGVWPSHANKSSQRANEKNNAIASIFADVVKVSIEASNAFEIRVLLNKSSENSSPILKNLFVSTNYVSDKIYEDSFIVPQDIVLNVPSREQMSIPKIGNSICSPTSLAMIMDFYGQSFPIHHITDGVKDEIRQIYGNWSYNVAFASEKGFFAFVQYCSQVEEVYNYIQQGIPIVASIKTVQKEALTGAFQAYPQGHLLVVKGFKYIDNQIYVSVNDPATDSIHLVSRDYLIEEFIAAWRHVIYVICPPEKALILTMDHNILNYQS